jgi:drug/metabolite transporter (DMT)-like permease
MIKQQFHLDRNTILGLSAILLWSTSVALVRSIAEKTGPFTSGASVYLAGGLLLGGHFFLAKRSVKDIWKLPHLYLFGCGTLFVIYTVALYLALGIANNRSQTLELGMVNYFWPILSILFSLVLLSKKAKVGLIPGTLFALIGIFLILTQGTKVSWNSFLANLMSNPTAYGLAIIAAISWALYSNLTHRWAGNSHEGAVPLFVIFTGFVLLFLRFLYPENSSCSIRLIVEIVCLSLTTALGYVFWDISMRKGDVVLVMAFSYLTPFFSTVVSCLYLRVIPGMSFWIGVLLVTIGSLLSWCSIESQKSVGLNITNRFT